MPTAYETVLKAMRSLGGERDIQEVAAWITQNSTEPVSALATVMADLASPPNNSTQYPPERQFLERVERGRYRIRTGWVESEPLNAANTEEATARTIGRLSDRSAVIAAIEEYDAMGAEAFFDKYKFGPAKWWYLIYDGKQYASKAIAGVAAWNQFGRPGKPNNFTGGEIVAKKLTELGFKVVNEAITDRTALPEEVDESYPEEIREPVLVNRYERNATARMRCIEIHGSACQVCGMDFESSYGSDFVGLIHVHHLNPRAKATGLTHVNPKTDLIPVCPNCHAALHHGGQLRLPVDLRQKKIKAAQHSQRLE